MKSVLGSLVLLFSTHFCLADQGDVTMLFPQGNREVAERYANFERSNLGCQTTSDGPRVLLTGFGLFDSHSYNISGAVIENLSSSSFWPDALDSANGVLPEAHVPFKTGVLSQVDRGARIYNRQILMRGRYISVCLIIADVLWDFAGAVFVHEMERFQPQIMIMSGIGDGSLEAGAINHALAMPGFAPNGQIDQLNTPQSLKILPDVPLDSTVNMSWDNLALEKLVAPKVRAIGFTLSAPTAAQPSNDYICNNVSYLVIQAAAHRALTLAGGELLLKPKIKSNPKIGFFHYPAEASLEQAPEWAQILLTLVDGSLQYAD